MNETVRHTLITVVASLFNLLALVVICFSVMPQIEETVTISIRNKEIVLEMQKTIKEDLDLSKINNELLKDNLSKLQEAEIKFKLEVESIDKILKITQDFETRFSKLQKSK